MWNKPIAFALQPLCSAKGLPSHDSWPGRGEGRRMRRRGEKEIEKRREKGGGDGGREACRGPVFTLTTGAAFYLYLTCPTRTYHHRHSPARSLAATQRYNGITHQGSAVIPKSIPERQIQLHSTTSILLPIIPIPLATPSCNIANLGRC